jgi:hypothetical protein
MVKEKVVSMESKQWEKITDDIIESMAWTGRNEEERLMMLFTGAERTVYNRAKAAGSSNPLLDVIQYSTKRIAKARA